MTLAPFDHSAHDIVSRILDEAEANYVRTGVCKPEQAANYLTVQYIERSGDFLENGGAYIESEGRIAADLFLFDLPKGGVKARYNKNHRKCALQLHWHTQIYFRDYYPILGRYYNLLLQNLPDLDAIDRNGVLQLAATHLPDARANIRRERRRRGASVDRLIVSDNTMKIRTNNTTKHLSANISQYMKVLIE